MYVSCLLLRLYYTIDDMWCHHNKYSFIFVDDLYSTVAW